MDKLVKTAAKGKYKISLLVLIFSVLLGACTQQAQNKTLDVESINPTFEGLGSSIEDWEKNHKKDRNSDESFLLYDNNRFALMDYEGIINHLEISWGDDGALKFEDAKTEATKYIPSDSHLEETYNPREYRIVERYTSESLSPFFDESAWLGSPPGEFIIIYRKYDFGVTSVVIALGNNP